MRTITFEHATVAIEAATQRACRIATEPPVRFEVVGVREGDGGAYLEVRASPRAPTYLVREGPHGLDGERLDVLTIDELFNGGDSLRAWKADTIERERDLEVFEGLREELI